MTAGADEALGDAAAKGAEVVLAERPKGVSIVVGRAIGGPETAPAPGSGAQARSAGYDQSATGSGIVCTGALNPPVPPIQVETGKRVARTNGKSVLGVAAAAKPLALAPVIGERNSTPIWACRCTLCTNGFTELNRDNDNLTTSNL